MPPPQLARESMVTPRTTAAVLTDLEAKGLIAREPSPLHQKLVIDLLRPAGNAAWGEPTRRPSGVSRRGGRPG
ncbi:hypothetical protein [Actinoplanes sp. NPDC020271]|uniref:hypothetical protein n=1 Tax=Actinoplanes sp. NPDC020271 TaxID=3363896 RepID=UPI00378BF23E